MSRSTPTLWLSWCISTMNVARSVARVDSYSVTGISLDRFALWFPMENRLRLISVTVYCIYSIHNIYGSHKYSPHPPRLVPHAGPLSDVSRPSSILTISLIVWLSKSAYGLENGIRALRRSEKVRQNIDIDRIFIEKFSLFWDRWEALNGLLVQMLLIDSWLYGCN